MLSIDCCNAGSLMGKESKISKPINIGFAQCLIVMSAEFIESS
jgi:hypothetical protein